MTRVSPSAGFDPAGWLLGSGACEIDGSRIPEAFVEIMIEPVYWKKLSDGKRGAFSWVFGSNRNGGVVRRIRLRSLQRKGWIGGFAIPLIDST